MFSEWDLPYFLIVCIFNLLPDIPLDEWHLYCYSMFALFIWTFCLMMGLLWLPKCHMHGVSHIADAIYSSSCPICTGHLDAGSLLSRPSNRGMSRSGNCYFHVDAWQCNCCQPRVRSNKAKTIEDGSRMEGNRGGMTWVMFPLVPAQGCRDPGY